MNNRLRGSLGKNSPLRLFRKLRVRTAVLASSLAFCATVVVVETGAHASNVSKCKGVRIIPGQSIQAAIDSQPERTTFCLYPGAYAVTHSIYPKSYDRLLSAIPRRAILTGKGIYRGGLRGYGGPNGNHDILVQGFIIENFVFPWDNTWPRSAIETGNHWTVYNNEIRGNSQVGIALGTNSVLNKNFIHNNGRYGLVGGPGSGLLIENNEISSNNTSHYNINDDAGGSKIIGSSTGSTNIVFRGNYVHDNYGNGLWCDWANKNVVYENNKIINNGGIGIMHEASNDAVIRNNKLSNNGLLYVGKDIWFDADIFLNDSKNVEIYGNVIHARTNGIGMVNYDRGNTVFGLLTLAGDHVHDNTIYLPRGGTVGIVNGATATNLIKQ